MACFHPLSAFQTVDGAVVFVERGKIARPLTLPCGRCRGCRLVRSRSWAIRCVHEAQMHLSNSFITLTYDDDNYNVSLVYSDFQLFMRRLRKFVAPARIRFFCCGEYGDVNGRAHFHALIFGFTFQNGRKVGEQLYSSPDLDKLWPYGMATYGDVTFQSAGYVARYCIKKVNGSLAEEHYKRVNVQTGEIVDVEPEFGRMSLKPGIGYPWFAKYWRDVYAARDGVVVEGKVLPAPKYYDRLLVDTDLSLATDKDYDRYINSDKFKDDCTPERLAVRDEVVKARLDLYKRVL